MSDDNGTYINVIKTDARRAMMMANSQARTQTRIVAVSFEQPQVKLSSSQYFDARVHGMLVYTFSDDKQCKIEVNASMIYHNFVKKNAVIILTELAHQYLTDAEYKKLRAHKHYDFLDPDYRTGYSGTDFYTILDQAIGDARSGDYHNINAIGLSSDEKDLNRYSNWIDDATAKQDKQPVLKVPEYIIDVQGTSAAKCFGSVTVQPGASKDDEKLAKLIQQALRSIANNSAGAVTYALKK